MFMESIKCALIIREAESTIIRIERNIFILSIGKEIMFYTDPWRTNAISLKAKP